MFFTHVKLRKNNWRATKLPYSSKNIMVLEEYQRFSVAGHLSDRATMNPSTPFVNREDVCNNTEQKSDIDYDFFL